MDTFLIAWAAITAAILIAWASYHAGLDDGREQGWDEGVAVARAMQRIDCATCLARSRDRHPSRLPQPRDGSQQ